LSIGGINGESGRQHTPALQLAGAVQSADEQHSTQASEPEQVIKPSVQAHVPLSQTSFSPQIETQAPSSPHIWQLDASHPSPVAGQHCPALPSMQASPQVMCPLGQPHTPSTQIWESEQPGAQTPPAQCSQLETSQETPQPPQFSSDCSTQLSPQQ
jgi:hypothetical protein